MYSAAVESVDQVQAAVRFAQRHRVRLVVRNTGHDTAGRSSAPDSFQIHTHRMKQIEYHDNFRAVSSDIDQGPAVSVGAGVLLGEMYARGARDGWVVVGGECPTVGATGGFLQGGGVSSFHSFINGLAVDNVLEFEIVTAKVGKDIPGTLEYGDCSILTPPLLSRERLSWPIAARIRTSFGHYEEEAEVLLALSRVLQ